MATNISNVEVWSHAEIEYLVPARDSYKVSAQRLTYQRVSIATVFNGFKTLFGVSVQGTNKNINKELSTEYAVEKALVNPVFTINRSKILTQVEFEKICKAIYGLIEGNLKVVSIEQCTEEEAITEIRDITTDENSEEFESYDDIVSSANYSRCSPSWESSYTFDF